MVEKANLQDILCKESEEFDEIENTLRTENFSLKRDLAKLKLRFSLISKEDACNELGFDISQFLED